VAKILNIAGNNRWADYRRGSLSISQILTYQVDSCSFALKGEKPVQGSEVVIEDTAQAEPRFFAGIIDRVELIKSKAPLVWKVDCQDYTLQMNKKLVVETYLGWSADAIVRDILNKYCLGFSAVGVASGAPLVESTGTDFNYIMPSECLKWLCGYIGWQWYVDHYKVVHFFDPGEMGTPAPMSLQPGGRFSNFKVSIDHLGLRNRVYVLGGSMLSDLQTIEWKADGAARIWVLPWTPRECSLQVGGVVTSIGVEGVDEEDTKDYLVNTGNGYLRCSAGTDTPAGGMTMALSARQSIDVITVVDDLASQASLATLFRASLVSEASFTAAPPAATIGAVSVRDRPCPALVILLPAFFSFWLASSAFLASWVQAEACSSSSLTVFLREFSILARTFSACSIFICSFSTAAASCSVLPAALS
jgi:hypothetical protein